MSEEQEPVKVITTPVRIEYEYTPGVASGRYLRGLKQGKLLGAACDECGRVYIPPRGSCPRCAAATSTVKEVQHKGTVVTFCVVRVPSENITVDLPYCAPPTSCSTVPTSASPG